MHADGLGICSTDMREEFRKLRISCGPRFYRILSTGRGESSGVPTGYQKVPSRKRLQLNDEDTHFKKLYRVCSCQADLEFAAKKFPRKFGCESMVLVRCSTNTTFTPGAPVDRIRTNDSGLLYRVDQQRHRTGGSRPLSRQRFERWASHREMRQRSEVANKGSQRSGSLET